MPPPAPVRQTRPSGQLVVHASPTAPHMSAAPSGAPGSASGVPGGASGVPGGASALATGPSAGGGICVPDREGCGGFAGAVCPPEAPTCLYLEGADFGVCLTAEEADCVCSKSPGAVSDC